MTDFESALAIVAAIERPDARANALCLAAQELLDLGETAAAVPLLREGEAIAKSLAVEGWPGYARGCVAEVLARIELEGGLALAKDLKDPFEHARHHGNIAYEIAATDPAAAERVSGLLG